MMKAFAARRPGFPVLASSITFAKWTFNARRVDVALDKHAAELG
jgi:hypothetical protein